MDFSFSEEQELFRRTVRQFAKEVLLPSYSHWDKTDDCALRQRDKMGEVGLTALSLPERYGGANADFVTLGIAVEETARGDLSCAEVLTQSLVTAALVNLYAQEDIKDRYLPPLGRGHLSIAVAITEPQCGSDAAAITTRAIRDGDHYVITGEKSSISTGIQADATIIFAKTDPTAGARGVTALLVPADSPGYKVAPGNYLGLRAFGRGSIFLDEVRVSAKNLLGQEGAGFRLMMNQFDYSRALMGLMCIGLALQTIDETIEYVKTRTAFGQPVAKYQGVAFPIVEQVTQTEAARLLCYKALWLRDHDLPHTKETAMVKWWVPRLAFETTHQMLLLYGHAGYSDDYPVGQRMRDVLAFSIGEGTAQIMKLLLAREVFGREYAPS